MKLWNLIIYRLGKTNPLLMLSAVPNVEIEINKKIEWYTQLQIKSRR